MDRIYSKPFKVLHIGVIAYRDDRSDVEGIESYDIPYTSTCVLPPDKLLAAALAYAEARIVALGTYDRIFDGAEWDTIQLEPFLNLTVTQKGRHNTCLSRITGQHVRGIGILTYIVNYDAYYVLAETDPPDSRAADALDEVLDGGMPFWPSFEVRCTGTYDHSKYSIKPPFSRR